MTGQGIEESVQEVRRIFLVVLAAVALAAAAAYVLLLRDDGADDAVNRAAASRLFPVTFREAGFVGRPVHRIDTAEVEGTTKLGDTFSGGASTLWLVARCDSGSVTVQVGSLSSSRRCTGQAVGVAALDSSTATEGRLDVIATVSRPQRSAWGVAVYR